jgi:peroxiredoxin family protein
MAVAKLKIPGEEFNRAVTAAFAAAAQEALDHGASIFYTSEGLNIMEQPDGRCFEIRFIPLAPAAENYEVLRELARRAA